MIELLKLILTDWNAAFITFILLVILFMGTTDIMETKKKGKGDN